MAGKREKKVDLKKKEIEELVSLYAQRKKEKSKKIPNDFKVEEKKILLTNELNCVKKYFIYRLEEIHHRIL